MPHGVKERSTSISKESEAIKEKTIERPRTPVIETSTEPHFLVEKTKKDNGEQFDRIYTRGRFIGKVCI
jgi:hypothetical protein